ncbi:derlin Ecym_1171 [Eremothecium cymbalariae DBVPG|uniref:Derlin n=1 Tax=Eremothecium cymbalariae (strain CBS 270.75 / DBVPG 7215 / KCTC 17166 / NRRL Y-17582) TaxID=931890 RepID=G8JMV7_ERECY|nr:hypothetical protein Ecym_1171 [Eremothecium cymbalariae DBVPG\
MEGALGIILEGPLPITKLYLLGVVTCTLAVRTGLLNRFPHDVNLLIRRRQYHLLILSFFDVKPRDLVISLVDLGFKLSNHERVVNNSKRYLWNLLVLSTVITLLAYTIDTRMPSMVEVLKINIDYFTMRLEKTSVLACYTHICLILLTRGYKGCLLCFLPGYILYFVGEVLNKIYVKGITRHVGERFARQNG